MHKYCLPYCNSKPVKWLSVLNALCVCICVYQCYILYSSSVCVCSYLYVNCAYCVVSNVACVYCVHVFLMQLIGR